MIELDMPFVLFKDRGQLPAVSGVYVVAGDEAVLYIGRAQNLRRRWGHHHRAAQMSGDYRIYWREVAHGGMDSAEQEAITQYHPIWNERAAVSDGPRVAFVLPRETKERIQALILSLDLDAREVVIRAVAELWQREIGDGDRDVLAELDELKERVSKLEQPA